MGHILEEMWISVKICILFGIVSHIVVLKVTNFKNPKHFYPSLSSFRCSSPRDPEFSLRSIFIKDQDLHWDADSLQENSGSHLMDLQKIQIPDFRSWIGPTSSWLRATADDALGSDIAAAGDNFGVTLLEQTAHFPLQLHAGGLGGRHGRDYGVSHKL